MIRPSNKKEKETRGDMTIQDLLDRQFESIIDFKLGEADADSSKYEPMTTLLARWETIKKDKNSNHCHYQHNFFSPFVLSVDVMIEREALVVLLELS